LAGFDGSPARSLTQRNAAAESPEERAYGRSRPGEFDHAVRLQLGGAPRWIGEGTQAPACASGVVPVSGSDIPSAAAAAEIAVRGFIDPFYTAGDQAVPGTSHASAV
jgi:hypothetical protein